MQNILIYVYSHKMVFTILHLMEFASLKCNIKNMFFSWFKLPRMTFKLLATYFVILEQHNVISPAAALKHSPFS